MIEWLHENSEWLGLTFAAVILLLALCSFLAGYWKAQWDAAEIVCTGVLGDRAFNSEPPRSEILKLLAAKAALGGLLAMVGLIVGALLGGWGAPILAALAFDLPFYKMRHDVDSKFHENEAAITVFGSGCVWIFWGAVAAGLVVAFVSFLT